MFRSRVLVRVRIGSGLASGKGWVGTWPVIRLDPVILSVRVLVIGWPSVQQEGEGYLDLRKDDCAFEDQYLQPDFTVPLTPGSPTSIDQQLRSPLPTIPDENEDQNTEPEQGKKLIVLGDPPKRKREKRMDSEPEKGRRDIQEKETLKSSGSSSAAEDSAHEGSYLAEHISEKEQRKAEDDEDKDICERNSGVFYSPPPHGKNADKMMFGSDSPLNNDVQVRTGGGQRNRQPSNRYVSS